MTKKILKEFSELTNEQAYVHIFSKRMMEPVLNNPGEFYGCDQRIDILPFILNVVATVPNNGEIFDVGAGAGDIVDFALKEALPGTIINIEEPNPILLKAYKDKIKKYFHLNLGISYEGTLQDYYTDQKKAILPKQPQHLILAIHMIYHLTNFKEPHIDPEADLINAISFLYGLLAIGGSIFIVYADLLENPQGTATCGIAEKYFRAKYPNEHFADNLIAIYKARNALLGPNGNIEYFLKKRYPNTNPSLKSEKRNTHFFGRTIDDIAILALATELCPADNEKFDLSKLQFCIDYVKHHPEQIGLKKEKQDIPQKGFWRSNEPQVIAIIKRLN